MITVKCPNCDCLIHLDTTRKPHTEADRIRAKSDEELAEWLVFVEQRILECQPKLERPELYKDWLDWLKSEAEE